MADHFEHPGHDEPEGGTPAEGDFPADFFDDATEPSPVLLPPEDASPHDRPTSAPASRPGHDPFGEEPPPVVGPPTTFKAPPDLPEDDVSDKSSPFAAIMGFVLLGVLVTAWFVGKQPFERLPVAATPAAAPGPVAGETKPATASESAKSPDLEALEATVKSMTGKLDELAAQIKTIEGKLGDLPKPEGASDLKSLEGKVAELTKSVAAVVPLNDKIGTLGDRIGSVDEAVKSVKSDLAAMKDEVGKLAVGTTPKPAATETKPETDDSTAALNQGAELFKAGNYKGAEEVFQKLASADTKDARVYYYAALTHGLTTNKWDGDTLTTAAKGAELEKAGSPKASEIDAAFADLAPNLKPWLTYFRKQGK